jgi:L-arabinonolactonase
LPTMPTGLVLTEGDAVVACLDDGLYVVDPDARTTELLAPYPDGMHGRANDANADGSGNLVTGTLNLVPAPGTFWWFSSDGEWKLLDDDISNANGPVVIDVGEQSTLVFADTAAHVYAYPYNGAAGTVGARRVFGDSALSGGPPDGATADAQNGVWSCVIGAGAIARFTDEGLQRTVKVPPANPADVAFGGPELDRLYVVSIAFDLGGGPPVEEAKWLLAIDGLGVRGRPEPRFALH